MSDVIAIPLTPAQVAEFRRLSQAERDAREQLIGIPYARTNAARMVILGHHPVDVFDGQNLNIDLDTGMIRFVPKTPASGPQLVEESA